MTPPPAKLPTKPLSAPQKALRKLGLVRDIDLALHLPLRYEDETRITRLVDAREGDTVQIEAVVTACEVGFRPRRQLLDRGYLSLPAEDRKTVREVAAMALASTVKVRR